MEIEREGEGKRRGCMGGREMGIEGWKEGERGDGGRDWEGEEEREGRRGVEREEREGGRDWEGEEEREGGRDE